MVKKCLCGRRQEVYHNGMTAQTLALLQPVWDAISVHHRTWYNSLSHHVWPDLIPCGNRLAGVKLILIDDVFAIPPDTWIAMDFLLRRAQHPDRCCGDVTVR